MFALQQFEPAIRRSGIGDPLRKRGIVAAEFAIPAGI